MSAETHRPVEPLELPVACKWQPRQDQQMADAAECTIDVIGPGLPMVIGNTTLACADVPALKTNDNKVMVGDTCLLTSQVVGLGITGTILEDDQGELTEPARNFILKLNTLNSRIVFFTFGQDLCSVLLQAVARFWR